MRQQIETHAARGAPPLATTLQVLLIGLGQEVFAIETDIVREIIDPAPVTPVAGARSFLAGLINVRGNIVPLADLRERFGMPKTQATQDTRIVVLEIEIEGDPVPLAVVADKVFQVAEITTAGAQVTPRLGSHWRPEFIRCIAKWNGDFVIVPEFETILT